MTAQQHELQIRNRAGKLAVTCSCLLTRTRLPAEVARIRYWRRDGDDAPFRSRWHREYIEARTVFPAAEARAAWLAWHDEQGIETVCHVGTVAQ